MENSEFESTKTDNCYVNLHDCIIKNSYRQEATKKVPFYVYYGSVRVTGTNQGIASYFGSLRKE